MSITPGQRQQWREDAEAATYYGGNEQEQADRILALLDALDAAERERDEAQEHIARWLDDNPPLSTTERVQRGSTGDLSFDMMRYAGRMKARAEAAEAELDDKDTAVGTLLGENVELEATLDRVRALADDLATREGMASSNMRDPDMAADRSYYEGMRDALDLAETDLRAALDGDDR